MSAKQQAQEAKDKGNKFFSSGKYADAITWYTKAIQLDPTESAFYSNRAASYMSLNKFDEALKDSESCIKAKPSWVKGHYRKGLALMALSRYGEAVNAFNKGLEVEPSNADIRGKLGEAQDKARFEVKRFADDGTPLSPAQIAKEEGNVLFRLAKYDQAIEKYTRAVELSDNEQDKAVLYSNRALSHAQLQNHDAVVTDCTLSININPTAKVLIRRALAYEMLERYKKSLDDMRQALQLDPNARIASEAVVRLTRAVNAFAV
eukprot:TRINITY_DN121_c0_g1_i1.p1 TRINITY_DN121_c0_g1~~TRINITY_DN121_c0_g1_i1.p1  ORF type:complete len:262 (-),score=71.98 TRINITY_DN121_c0_g1_i1:107-892(-)